MTYAATTTAREGAHRRPVLRTAASVLTTGLCVGVLLVVLEAAVAEPDPAPRRAAVPDLPYGGALELPDGGIEPGALLGLGLLVLGLANGLVFAGAAALD